MANLFYNNGKDIATANAFWIEVREMAEIGKRIKLRRESLRMTQKELATKIGYNDKSTIAKIENGVNGVPRNKVAAFAEALDVSECYLMGWVNNPDAIVEMARDAKRIVVLADMLRDAIMCEHPVQDLKWYDTTTALLCGLAYTHQDMADEFAKNKTRGWK